MLWDVYIIVAYQLCVCVYVSYRTKVYIRIRSGYLIILQTNKIRNYFFGCCCRPNVCVRLFFI